MVGVGESHARVHICDRDGHPPVEQFEGRSRAHCCYGSDGVGIVKVRVSVVFDWGMATSSCCKVLGLGTPCHPSNASPTPLCIAQADFVTAHPKILDRTRALSSSFVFFALLYFIPFVMQH